MVWLRLPGSSLTSNFPDKSFDTWPFLTYRKDMETETTTTPEAHNIRPGDFFSYSWGYDQTNVDWFMVTKVTPKSVWIQAVETRTISDNGHSAQVAPTHIPQVRTVCTSYDYATDTRTTEQQTAKIVRKSPRFCSYDKAWYLSMDHGSARHHVGCDATQTATSIHAGR